MSVITFIVNPNGPCLKQQKHLSFCIYTTCQVANLNPKDLSYTLKDFVFKEIQRDWPGYSEADRRALESVLSRYVLLCHFFFKDDVNK